MGDDGSQGKPQRRAGAKGADRFASGYDFLLLNQALTASTFPDVMRCINEHRANKRVVLILVTYGGDANAAYRIGRFLQTVYEDVVAFIPAECKSAGTLLVTAANSVVITPFGEFGPLDIQLRRRDEIIGRRSGLTTRSALEELKIQSFEVFEHFMFDIVARSGAAVSLRVAADVASRMASQLMSKIYEQINPDALGQDYRDLNIALKYGERLDRRFGNLKPKALHRLVYDYPSHDFVIDLEEAQEIFQRVELPTPTLIQIISARSVDCLAPKSRDDGLVEMITSSGDKAPVSKSRNEKAERTKSDDEPPSFQGQRDGDGKAATA